MHWRSRRDIVSLLGLAWSLWNGTLNTLIRHVPSTHWTVLLAILGTFVDLWRLPLSKWLCTAGLPWADLRVLSV